MSLVPDARALQPSLGLPPPGRQLQDMRRVPRFAANLEVSLHSNGEVQQLVATNVGQHGLFVCMADPPLERQVVRLTLHLPDGPVSATARVCRRVVPASGLLPGMGVQLFGLPVDESRRWEQFIRDAAGRSVRLRSSTGSHGGAPVPVFNIRVRDQQRLREFLEQYIKPGFIVLHTPVVKDVDSTVMLVMVHPVTRQEFPLTGVVQEVSRQIPKSMSIRLQGLSPDSLEAFARFIDTGQAPGNAAAGEGAVRDVDPRSEPGDFDVDEFVDWADAVGAPGPGEGMPLVAGQPLREDRFPGLLPTALVPHPPRSPDPVTQPMEAVASSANATVEGLQRMVAVLEQQVEQLRDQYRLACADMEFLRQEAAMWRERCRSLATARPAALSGDDLPPHW